MQGLERGGWRLDCREDRKWEQSFNSPNGRPSGLAVAVLLSGRSLLLYRKAPPHSSPSSWLCVCPLSLGVVRTTLFLTLGALPPVYPLQGSPPGIIPGWVCHLFNARPFHILLLSSYSLSNFSDHTSQLLSLLKVQIRFLNPNPNWLCFVGLTWNPGTSMTNKSPWGLW